nr:gas vesicle protein K [Ktedonobacter robiniae]
MESQESLNNEQILESQHFTLLELLDRLLDKGAMVKGEILLSVADIDLVYLNLGLLLSSVKTVENAARRGSHEEAGWLARQPSSQEAFLNERPLREEEKEVPPAPLPEEKDQRSSHEGKEEASTSLEKEERRSKNDEESIVRALPSVSDPIANQTTKPKANIDPKNVEKGLAKLVLTLIDLIRQLMEKQAIRRVEDDQLSSDEIEKVGNAFLLLEEKMEELKETFGLTDEDLNLDLGPLGDLL